MAQIPLIPKEYLGEYSKNCGYTTTNPRIWTSKEIEWVKELLSKGYSNKEIAVSLDRSVTSVSVKIKRLKKKEKTYNESHIKEKYEYNRQFLNYIRPETILDLYSGENSFYKDFKCITNDINKNYNTDYHEDAFKLICKLYYEGKKFDLIDLDPFGSAYDCFDLAIKMAKKGLVITLGELGHKRWKRLDYVKYHYNINNLKDFTVENIIAHIQKIALRNKKILIVWKYKEWKNIGRVWFIIKEKKVTEQWEKKVDKKQMTIFDIGG